MHVFYLNARYLPEGVGGPAHTTRFLAEQVVQEGHRATVFCRASQHGVTREQMAGVEVIRVGLDVPILQTVGLFAQALDAARPDVIHSLFPREFPLNMLAQSAARRAIPIVQTLLSFNLMCPHSFVREGRNCTRQCPECRRDTEVERAYCGQVAAAVGISRYMLELHEREGLFADTPVKRVIYDAYEPPLAAPASGSSPIGEGTELNTFPTSGGGWEGETASSRPLSLGYLGRLDPLKGVDRLLEALTAPALKNREWRLLVAGTGSPAYLESLKAKYPDPRIHYLGFVRQDELLANIDVLVAPALWQEPLGRIILEAYAHGVPVIASRRGGMAESVEHGRTGYLFEPEQRGTLVETIRHCMEAPELLAEMGANALGKWRQTYTPAVIAAQYLQVYADVTRHQ
jgi:glycosyltransferase involved in cell wall biosynthesis